MNYLIIGALFIGLVFILFWYYFRWRKQTLAHKTDEHNKSSEGDDAIYCNFCSKKIGGVSAFSCKYCEQMYCEEHRIPERHDCYGQPGSPSKDTFVSYRWSKK